jgi:hypothetical protein
MGIDDCRFPIANFKSCRSPKIGNRQLAIGNALLGLFMTCVLAATATEFAEFQTVGRCLLILGRHVVPTFAIRALKHNVIAWHLLKSYLALHESQFYRIYMILQD